jgi:hypothetical protein
MEWSIRKEQGAKGPIINNATLARQGLIITINNWRENFKSKGSFEVCPSRPISSRPFFGF